MRLYNRARIDKYHTAMAKNVSDRDTYTGRFTENYDNPLVAAKLQELGAFEWSDQLSENILRKSGL